VGIPIFEKQNLRKTCTMPKRHIEIDEDEVKRLYAEEGLSAKQIANVLGIPRYAVTIEGILAAAGVETKCWCGIGRRDHPRCAGCGILVGPKHITKTIERFLDGAYCTTCLKNRKKLQCYNCGAHQIWYDHEIVRHIDDDIDDDFDDDVANIDIIIKGVCYSCGTPNEFINREPAAHRTVNGQLTRHM